MGDAFIVRRGGGGMKWDSAIIHVYAPAGSTVTATKGSTTKTLKEHSVSGADSEYIMVVKYADYGTWTITGTLSGQQAISSVAVADNIEYLVTLSYVVPSDYQVVEYLESTGTQDIYLTDMTIEEIIVDMAYTALDGTGCGGTTPLEDYTRFAVGAKEGKYMSMYGNKSDTSTVNADTSLHSYRLVPSGVNCDMYVDGNLIYRQTSASSVSAPSRFHLFAYNGYSSLDVVTYNKIRLYHFKHRKHDLYPCYRKSDNVAGLWDATTQTFRTNSGTGTFIVGGNT